jgi:glycosyltransferase involved in cell wall biosynthesis
LNSNDQPRPAPGSPSRWFTFIPLRYQAADSWWQRDMGLLCLGFRAWGVDSRFVLLPGPDGPPQADAAKPFILASPEQLADPAWWTQWKLDGVVAVTWALPQHEPVVRAIKQAGIRLAIKLDMGGDRTPRGNFLRYLQVRRVVLHDQGAKAAGLQAFFRTLLPWLWPKPFAAAAVRHLRYADKLLIETPGAREQFARFLQVAGAPELVERTRLVPHPVTTDMVLAPGAPRQQLILSVGRWDSMQKDTPKMIAVLAAVLAEYPGCRARLIGGGGPAVENLLRTVPAEIRSRIEYAGRVPHEELPAHYRAAQVFLCTSWHESFNIAAAEALCCGCSVVGPADIASMVYFAGARSGTPAASRSVAGFQAALRTELEAWASGGRDPLAISVYWRDRLHADRVAATILETMAGGQPA